MKGKYNHFLFFICLIFSFFELEGSDLRGEKTKIVTVKVPRESSECEEVVQMRLTWQGYDSKIKQWGLDQYRSIARSLFSWKLEKHERIIYLDTDWSAIYKCSQKPLPIIYTSCLYDCVGVGVLERGPTHKLEKVGIFHRYCPSSDFETDYLWEFLSEFSPENSKVSLVSGYASEHLKSVLDFIVEKGFKDIELTHLPCIRLPDTADDEVCASYIFPEEIKLLDGVLFNAGNYYQSLGFCPESESFFLRENGQEDHEFYPKIEGGNLLERILRQSKEDPDLALGGGLKDLC